MIKTSTPLNNSSALTGNEKVNDLIPGTETVKMLINYSKALQVIHCKEFATCLIILN